MLAISTDGGDRQSLTYEREIDLTRSASEGDATAQRELVIRLLPQVRRTMSYLTGDPVATDDLTQIAILRLLEVAGAYRGGSSLEYWAGRVSARMAMAEIKKQRRRLFLAREHVKSQPVFSDGDKSAVKAVIQRRLQSALSKLMAEERVAIVLKYVEGYSIVEIAQTTDAPVNTVRTRLMRGKKKLRKIMGKHPELREWVLENSQ